MLLAYTPGIVTFEHSLENDLQSQLPILLSTQRSIRETRYDATMTDLLPAGKQDMDPQTLSSLPDSQQRLSRQSSDIDYELAQQLIQHSQGRRDTTEISSTAQASEPGQHELTTSNSHFHNDQNATNGKGEHDANSRRSVSHDRMSESQYAPVAPAMGQACT